MKSAMKKSMKKSAMKGMKRRAMKKSVVGKKYSVFRDSKAKTSGGLKKSDLIKNKRGKVVGRKANANGKKNFKRISAWTTAFKAARKALGIKGFKACGGKSAKGQ